jgi:hypothetical protein
MTPAPASIPGKIDRDIAAAMGRARGASNPVGVLHCIK